MTCTHYLKKSPALRAHTRLAVVCDLHNGAYERLMAKIQEQKPHAVLVVGDFLEEAGQTECGFSFLSAAAREYPTFCTLGNHDVRCRIPDLRDKIKETGAVLLDNAFLPFRDFTLGGLTTGYPEGQAQKRRHTPPPDTDFLAAFTKQEGFLLLLSHHPEYYEPYIKGLAIDLTLSGHAHGGQWELFGRGVYAPGQGLFPRLTAGMYDGGRLLVSRGLCPTHRYFLRLFNPRELVILDLAPAD